MDKKIIDTIKALADLPEKYEQLEEHNRLQCSQMIRYIVSFILMSNGKISIPQDIWQESKKFYYYEVLESEEGEFYQVLKLQEKRDERI
jgi:hypothetical protein